MFKQLVARLSKFFCSIAHAFLRNYFDGLITLSSDLYLA